MGAANTAESAIHTGAETTAASGGGDSPRWRRRFAKLLCLSTLGLILLGGLVTSHDAGLAVPDWPDSYGQSMFLFPPSMWVGGIFWEHTHRLVASGVGLLTLILAVWLALTERRVWVTMLGFAALAAVVFQGILGGVTVVYLLPPAISVSHAVLAQTFFLMTITLAYAQSRERSIRAERHTGSPGAPRALGAWAVALLFLVFFQLIAGAAMRHTESGLAIPDFPTMGGQWLPIVTDQVVAGANAWRMEHSLTTGRPLPDVTAGQVWVHYAHRVGAALVLLPLASLLWMARRPGVGQPVRRLVYGLSVLIGIQILLGAFTIWSVREPFITSAHVATGALLLAGCLLLCLRAFPLRITELQRYFIGHHGTAPTH